MHKYNYQWKLAELPVPTRGKVFSCFACGGGSSMGYKLAGFDVVGCNEIDPRMAAVYKKNLNPKYIYVEDIREFVAREDYPPELYQLDILDGSPPCSSFSIAGRREELWGVEHKFREGQKKQVLDTLFFDFIKLAKKLKPKVIVAENVPALAKGNALLYYQAIIKDMTDAGYYVTVHVLDASRMGVPQKRKRLFFIALRQDLIKYARKEEYLFGTNPCLHLDFCENEIPLKDFADYKGEEINKNCKSYKYWKIKKEGEKKISVVKMRLGEKGSSFNQLFVSLDNPLPTITARAFHKIMHWDKPLYLSKREITLGSSFPLDYDFGKEHPEYICGMSVPPVMIANIANVIWEQWLCRMNKKNK